MKQVKSFANSSVTAAAIAVLAACSALVIAVPARAAIKDHGLTDVQVKMLCGEVGQDGVPAEYAEAVSRYLNKRAASGVGTADALAELNTLCVAPRREVTIDAPSK